MIGRPDSAPRRAAEEAFCRDVDSLLIKRLASHAGSEESKRRLASMPHLRDRKLVSLLSKLGITPEGLIAVQLVPMVLVAWASGNIDDKEREFILQESGRFGIGVRSEARAMLEHWLEFRPSPLLMETWRRFFLQELATLSGNPRTRLIEMTRQQMQAVAKSSGGFLGFGRVCGGQHRVMSAIAKVLDQCEGNANRRRS